MLALVVGTRPAVSPAMMLAHLQEFFGITEDWVSVHGTTLDDFIVQFNNNDDLERVLRTPSPAEAPFALW